MSPLLKSFQAEIDFLIQPPSPSSYSGPGSFPHLVSCTEVLSLGGFGFGFGFGLL